MFRFILPALVFSSALLISPAVIADCPPWTQQHAAREIITLRQQITEWDQSYHRDATSPIADELYDQAREQNYTAGKPASLKTPQQSLQQLRPNPPAAAWICPTVKQA